MAGLPYSFEAEQSIIGSVLVKNDIIDTIPQLKPYMFYSDTYKQIYDCMLEIYNENSNDIDEITLRDKLDRRNQTHITDAHIKQCYGQMLTADNVHSHVKIVIENYMLREITKTADKMKDAVDTQGETADSIIDLNVDKLIEVLQIHRKGKGLSPNDMVDAVEDMIKNNEVLDSVQSGFKDLDELLVGGFLLKNVSIIGGCSGNLKSTFRNWLEINIMNDNQGVITVATEQDRDIELGRKLSAMSHVPYKQIQSGNMVEEERDRVLASTNALAEKNYHLICDRSLSIASMRKHIEKIIARYGNIKFVTIDLFDRLTDVLDLKENFAQGIIKCLAQINAMALDLNIHVALLVQINREATKGNDKHPKRWHIRGSNSFEDLCRLMLLLHRPKYYNAGVNDDILKINIAKQSQGQAGEGVDVELDFVPEKYLLKNREETNKNKEATSAPQEETVSLGDGDEEDLPF